MKKIQTPQWFTDSLNLGERFIDEVKIPAECAGDWVKALYEAWTTPEGRMELLDYWATLSQEEKRFETVTRSKNWGEFNSQMLVQIVHNFIAVKRGRETFLPSYYDDPAIRAFLLSNLLLVNSLAQLEANPQEEFGFAQFKLLSTTHQALAPVLKWSWYYMAGPFAASEIKKRGSNHVGYGFALLLLRMRPERKTHEPLSLFLHSDPDELLETLGKAVFGATFPYKRNAGEMSVRRRWGKGKKEADCDLPGDIAEHINSIIRTNDPAEALAQSLNGDLNIVPKGIGNEITKKARPKKREIPIVFDNSAVVQAPDSGWRPEDWVRARELDKRLKGHDFTRRYLELDMPANTTKKKRAEALSITDRQLRRDKQKVREMLKK